MRSPEIRSTAISFLRKHRAPEMTAPPVDAPAGKSKHRGYRHFSEVGRSRPRRAVGSAACPVSASGGSRWNERDGNRRMIRLTIGWLTMFVVGTDLFVVSPLLR